MTVTIRLAAPADIMACGRILHEAFKGINEHHGFENIDIPTVDYGCRVAGFWVHRRSCYSVVAEAGGCVVGVCFLYERSSIRGIALVSVDPDAQGQGVGRRLMGAALEHCRGSRGVRLVLHTFNTSSVALYASLEFEAREPLLLMCGQPESEISDDVAVRPMRSQDLDACGQLCKKVHGFERTNELSDGLQIFTPFVALRAGRIVGYASAPAVWSANHGVAESEDDMRALLLGISASMSDPLSFLLPIRQSSFFRWCIDHGMRVVKPMTLMTVGDYQEPAGCYFTSVVY